MPLQPPVLVAISMQFASKRFHPDRIFGSSSNGQPRRFLQMAFEDRARLWKGSEGRASPSWRNLRRKCGAVCGGRRGERISEGEFFRLTATIISKSIRCFSPGLIRGDVHLMVLVLRLPKVANRERSSLYYSPDCAELQTRRIRRYRGCLAMTASMNRELRCNPRMSTALSVYNSAHSATRTIIWRERRNYAPDFLMGRNQRFESSDNIVIVMPTMLIADAVSI